MNQCQLMGRLTRDPELRMTTSQIPVASFSIAVDRRKGKDGSQETDFFNIVAWRHTAEFVTKYFAKGQRVAVVGQIQNKEYTDKEGVQRRTTEIIAESVHFADSKREDNGQGYQAQQYQAPGTGYQAPPSPYTPPAYTPPPPSEGGYSTNYSVPPQGEAAQFQPLTPEEEKDLPF